MGRPTDWSPLASSDPVPGNPAAISQEAAHLASVAQQIQAQVGRLRAIATGQSAEKGLHVDKLKSASGDVANQLDKVVGRYQQTSSALSGWVPDLEYAQAQSLKALAAAQGAASQQSANQPVTRPSGQTVTPAQQQQDQARAKALNQANADLAAAQQMLNAATSYRDQKGSDTRNKIENAINDGVADSWWDQFKGFIEKYAWLIRDICTGLEILATILAVVCLFIPGLDIVAALLLVAFGASLLAMLGRGALAATGNGSWLDFGLDVVACLTFGTSSLFSRGLAATASTATKVGEGLVQGDRAMVAAENMTKFFSSTAGRLIGQGRAEELALQWATQAIPDLAKSGESLSYWGKVWSAIKAGGSLDDATNFSKVVGVATRYLGNPDVAASMSKATAALNFLRTGAIASWTASLSGLIGGGGQMENPAGPVFRLNIPLISPGWDWVETHTTTSGLTTGQANAIVNALQVTPVGPEAALFRAALGGGW